MSAAFAFALLIKEIFPFELEETERKKAPRNSKNVNVDKIFFFMS